MIVLTAAASVLVFLIACQQLGIVRIGTALVGSAKTAVSVMRDTSLSDEEREKQARSTSIALFKGGFSILIRCALALIAATVPLYIAQLSGLCTIQETVSFLIRWDVVLIICVVFGALYWALRRPKTDTQNSYRVNYSPLDRMLHYVAFGAPSTQATAAETEKLLFQKQYQQVGAEKPIFVTSLPRAGTTLLLEVLNGFPDVATHIYRDMPFVMAPLLWSRLSGNFNKEGRLTERAHGDGMQIGYESPEAFEEILWRAFWPAKYQSSHIAMWDREDDNPEARQFLRDHFKKIVMLRNQASEGRYLSKNNANIARLSLLRQMFPEAKIAVLVRDPLAHAASMHRQHLNFLKLHRQNRFIRRYMADIGHYEFGELHRPIDFPDRQAFTTGLDPMQVDYWLGYWIAAFSDVARYADDVAVISYEKMCQNARPTMARLCEMLELASDGFLDRAADRFRPPSQHQIDQTEIDPDLLQEAETLHRQLAARHPA